MRKQAVAVLFAGAAVMLWSGCSSNSSPTGPANATKVTVTISSIGQGQVIAGGPAVAVQGTIVGDSDITNVTYKVLDASQNDQTAEFTIALTQGYLNLDSANLASNLSMTIQALSSATAGTYTLEIKADVGSYVTNTGELTFTVPRDIDTATVTIGSLSNPSVGSSIDLDYGTVLLAAQATQSGSGADLVATWSDAFNSFRIFTPVYAADSSNIVAFENWVDPAATSFCAVSSPEFDLIQTKAQIEQLYLNGTPITSADCSTGDVFVVKTDQGNYVAIEIGTFNETQTGTALIKWGK